ncbi:hypothetical protein C2869_05305 [Saccharobesus litoralis]|uniref:Uncharacterized protein n=1 Tax=Saccharobesus litoralis TaxID=2172099 RepID=A0A2S0VNX9_9ALTE|nr:hypothetical protein [Saccharobesus litoralis]AWB65893.1 hypothetical protein C2869_05305 [Saccharobesus litoralis]
MFKITKMTAMLACLGLSLAATSTSAKSNKGYQPDGYKMITVKTPAKVKFHATGVDAHSNGDIFVATRFGDVWRLRAENWLKVADGLHEPTGLLVDEDGSVIVGHKPELTRLIDLDGDGIMDDYINLADNWNFHDNYHEFNFGPVRDSQGNYYGTLNLGHGAPNSLAIGTMGSGGGYRGWTYQVTKDGEFVPYASGLRSPAGIGISPNDELFFTDNQGDWVETSKLHFVKKGKFYGHPVSLRDHPDWSVDKIKKNSYNFDMWHAMRELPVVWFPHIEVASSPGNPEWDTSQGKFGPFAGQMFVSDVTQSNLFRVVLDKVNGEYQGAVINFMSGFQSGNIRLSFDNQGQLWVGQTARGWGSKGGKPFGIQKVVWDGTNPFEILDIKLTKTGFKVNFTEAVSNNSRNKVKVNVEEWNYHYSNKYGSAKMNEQKLQGSNLTWSNGNKTLTFDLPLTAEKVLKINFNGLVDKKGRKPSVKTAYYTLNQLRK